MRSGKVAGAARKTIRSANGIGMEMRTESYAKRATARSAEEGGLGRGCPAIIAAFHCGVLSERRFSEALDVQ